MRNAKLWSLLLAFVLLCGCVLGVLFTTASAAGTYELNVGGAGEFATVEAALNSIADADLSAYESITVKVNGAVTEANTNALLFGQKTIWKDTGVMMPITITGSGSLSFPQGTESSYRKFASANDITFKDMNLPISSLYTMFFAGNGKLTFDGCAFGTGFNFRIFADNYTGSTYEGWTEEDYNALKDEDGHIKSVATIKNGAVTTLYDSKEKRIIAATGSNVDYEATVGAVIISANNTKAELYLENVDTAHPNARYGSNPVAETILTVKNCDVKGYRAAGHETNSKTFSGDITINVIGGTYYGFGRLLNGCTITADTADDKAPGAGNGDVTITIDGAKPISSFKSNSSNFIQATWGTVSIGGDLNVTWKDVEFSRAFTAHNSSTTTVCGDYNLYIDGIETGTIKGMFAEIKGNVKQIVKNVNTVSTGYTNIRLLETTKIGGNVENDFSDWSLNYTTDKAGDYFYTYLGSATENATITGNITNNLKNITTSAKTLWVCGNYKGTVNGNITNTVEGNCSFGSGFIGGNLYGNVKGNITNTIKSGNFAPFADETYAPFTAGIYTNGNVDGKITNYIQGGTFARCSQGFSAFLASHQTSSHYSTGGIENVIDGGTFAGYVFAGPRGNANVSNSAQGEPAIKTTINGGTFHGFWSLRGKVTGDVVTVINGGTFEPYSSKYPYVFSGALYRNTGEHVSGNVYTTINGGTFNNSVITGVINNNDVVDKVQPGKASLTVCGGTFMKHIFAGSYDPDGNLRYAENELIIDLTRTEADELKLLGSVGMPADWLADQNPEDYTVKVIAPENGGEIIIGTETEIYVNTAEGKINFHQTEGWLGHDYFFIDESTDDYEITVSEGAEVVGAYEIGANYLSGGYRISGATLIFEERVGIRILLDPEMVALYQDGFTYSVARGGEEPFMQGTELEKWTDPADGTVYDSFVISGIGLSDFDQYFVLKVFGAMEENFSIYDLAVMAQDVWTGNWKIFAEAICNLTDVYTDEEGVHDEEIFALYEVEQTRTATRNETAVAAATLTPLMNDAVGIELNVTLTEGFTANLLVKVNGQVIENALTLDGQKATVNLLFGASYMTDAFILEIVDESGDSIFTLTASIEKIVSELAENTQNPVQENAQALLYYIQKAALVA